MRWDCGYLNPKAPIKQWLKTTPIWNLPKDLRQEALIMLNMPGFTFSYHIKMIERSWSQVWRYLTYAREREESVRPEVIENWMSVTREDARQLSCIRPENGYVPIISRMHLAEDYQTFGSKKTQELYRVSPQTITNVLRRGPMNYHMHLPAWFLQNMV